MRFNHLYRASHVRRQKYAVRLFVVAVVFLLFVCFVMQLHTLPGEKSISESLSTPNGESVGVHLNSSHRFGRNDTVQTPQEQQLIDVITKHIDSYDVLPLREGESFISFKEFVACLGARLHLDVANRRELPFPPEDQSRSIPFMITTLSLGFHDAKQSVCQHSVSIRHLLYVNHGDIPEVRLGMEGLQLVFQGWTRRLLIRHHPETLGLAAALNVGLREALALPPREVPFVHVWESGARLSSAALRTSLERMHGLTRGDEGCIHRLQAEVDAGEGRRAGDGVRLRASPSPASFLVHTPPEGIVLERGWAKLSTSALCPGGVLDDHYAAAKALFRDHHALVISDSTTPTASFFISRLAMLVVGYFDENTFPGGFELQDYCWRAKILGFGVTTLDELKIVKRFYDDVESFIIDGDAAMGVFGKGDGRSSSLNPKPELSPQARAFLMMMRKTFTRGVFSAYMMWKWQVQQPVDLQNADPPGLPYDGERFPDGLAHVRVDSWLLDWRRVVHIKRYLSGQTQNASGINYNSSLLSYFI
ncbi:unnamed protein product [Phytomonas sp. EM1]|nr:unnamed protein product [Phytomonas sp. EM1]|eukprot:CCW64105.1 unnamed protein product [Phytomonas sp. isolate EM1]